MKASVILLSFLLFWNPSFGQFGDSFTDGNLNLDPVWSGMPNNFQVESEVLKLNAPAMADVSFLSTPSESINNATWEFDVTLNFNPSSSNYLKVYLVADQADLTADLQGYYLKIGGTPDEVSLYHQAGTTIEEIIDGLDGRLSLSLVELSIRVTRDDIGNWAVYSRLKSESTWFTEGTVMDNREVASQFFGLVCTYTSTRSTKFSFDNFVVSGDPYIDVLAPEVKAIQFLSDREMRIDFNENLDSLSSIQLSNYILNDTLQPAFAAGQDSSVMLNFDSPFAIANSLHITGVEDLHLNKLDTTLQLVYVEDSPALVGELVINELMPDPIPREDLPEVEFIELLNTSKKVINLKGWQISDLVSAAELNEYLLFPDSLVILCAEKDQLLLDPYGDILAVSSWPSLNNSGDLISLNSPDGLVIDQVDYSPSWFNDELKKDGGWTLERIFPKHNCSSEANWSASKDTNGGTPGEPNSIFMERDVTPPLFVNEQIYSDSIVLSFNESIRTSALTASLSPSDVDLIIGRSDHQITVHFSQSVRTSQPFLLTINGVEDCNNNIAEEIQFDFIIPDTAKQVEVVINELLFNPKADGVDFIELYNPTSKYFDLSGWIISNGENKKSLALQKTLLAPNDYIVLTPDINILSDQYPARSIEQFIETALPAMNNDEGIITIFNSKEELLDSVSYSENQHFQLINDVEGVSLERVSPTIASVVSGNWQSAASTVGFATPGYVNSQYAASEISGAEFSVEPAIIIPDNNGQDDFATLYYDLNQSGFVANIGVYNINGHLVEEIANNESLGMNGHFIWNGTNDQGKVVPMGHYLIIAELFNSVGQKKVFRHKVVVGAIF